MRTFQDKTIFPIDSNYLRRAQYHFFGGKDVIVSSKEPLLDFKARPFEVWLLFKPQKSAITYAPPDIALISDVLFF